MLLQSGECSGTSRAGESEFRKRMVMLDIFLTKVRYTIPSLQPLFFFSDNDFGQQVAIEKVYNMISSRCLWHMQRAIQEKIQKLKWENWTKSCTGKRNISIAGLNRGIRSLARKHFDAHPYFFLHQAETIESLYKNNYDEMKEYCMVHELDELWIYIERN